nr:uncharacterized protein LOC115269159 [Aedes albopictus]
MLRFVIVLCSVISWVYTAPTVHLGESDSDVYGYSTELPLIIDPIVVTTKPIVETSYVNPVTMDSIPWTATTAQQPAYQQPQPPFQHHHQAHQPQQPQQPHQPQIQYYFYQPRYPYNMHPYQVQPAHGYQWQNTVPLQQPVIQPENTNVLPCTNPYHHSGGYQQYGY